MVLGMELRVPSFPAVLIPAVFLLLGPVLMLAQVSPDSGPMSIPKSNHDSAPNSIHGGDHIKLPPPPATEKVPVVDNYFGTKITDDYRWLEEPKSAETRDFIDQQIAYTDRYLKQARVRPEFADSLDALVHITSWSTPIQRGDSYFFMKQLSSEEQASIYVRHGWSAASAPESKTKKPPILKQEKIFDW